MEKLDDGTFSGDDLDSWALHFRLITEKKIVQAYFNKFKL
jgi:hypothetical protein